LKLVFPQAEPEARPENFLNLRFDNFFLQPMDGPDRIENLQSTIAYCLANPIWRLSLQTHKIMGIP
jgi:7-carboxy-7-deazaguanine synthase